MNDIFFYAISQASLNELQDTLAGDDHQATMRLYQLHGKKNTLRKVERQLKNDPMNPFLNHAKVALELLADYGDRLYFSK